MSRLGRLHAAVCGEHFILVIALSICCAHIFTGCGGGSFFEPHSSSTPTIDKLHIGLKSSVLGLGQSLQLSLSAVYSDGSSKDETAAARWSSRNESILQISPTGMVKAVGVGSTTISAALSGLTASAAVEVTTGVPLSLSISPKTVSLAQGETQQLLVSATLSDGTSKDETAAAEWTSGNASILQINSAGVAKAVGVGSTSISATVVGLTASTAVEVTAAVPLSLSVSPNPLSLASGETRQLTVSATLSDGTSKDETAAAKWTSGNASILQISPAGVAKAVGVGSTSISATVVGLTTSAAVEVTTAVPMKISISPISLSLASGETRQLTVNATLSDGTSKDETAAAKWSSVNAAIAAINSTGLAKAVSVGSTSISATIGGLTTSAAVEVTTAVPTKISISPASLSLAKGETRQLAVNATLTDGTAKDETGTAKWRSVNTSILEVNSAGLVKAVGLGSTSIYATVGGLTASAAGEVTAAVPLSISISPVSVSLPKGETHQMALSIALSDGTSKDGNVAVKWTSGNASILEIDSAGLATAIGVGSTSISATLSGLTASAAVEVTAAVPMSISISPDPLHLLAGSSLPLKALSSFSDGQVSDVTATTVFTVDDDSIVRVDEHGNALGFHAGTTQIKAESRGKVAQVTAVVAPVILTSYFSAEAGAPDATLRLSAIGDSLAPSCSMVYVFNQNQQLAECCGCAVSSGGLRTLSLNQDLRSNPLTQVSPDAGTVMVVAADEDANSACDPAAITGAKAGIGWFTNMQTSGTSVYAMDTNLSSSATTNEFLDSVQTQCQFVMQLGSGRGICSCGTGE